MNRKILKDLQEWLISSSRKPLVLRGARQVGKTWLVRYLAEQSGKVLIELNFERRANLISLFQTQDPKIILRNLGASLGLEINLEKSILFLDEIQAAPELLAQLRWFAEELPELAVIAAGSLLEFVLKDHAFSMPVGRINYQYLEPMSFDEFLMALGQKKLLEYLEDLKDFNIPEALHQKLIEYFKEYLIVGGMPAAVSSWITEQSLIKVNQIHHDLLATYRDDFAKYKGRLNLNKLDEVLLAVPKMIGEKFMFSRVSPGGGVGSNNSAMIKQIINLFEKARLCHSVLSTSANGVPLGAEVKSKFFKEIFIDVGLCNSLLGLSLNQINQVHEINLVNQGGVAEQVVGQLLRTIEPAYKEPALYYWVREEKNANSELDYVLAFENKIIPIEVKTGVSGSLKSLHYFMEVKKYKFAVRINSDLPSLMDVKIAGREIESVEYQLLSLPFYLIGHLPRLIKKFIK